MKIKKLLCFAGVALAGLSLFGLTAKAAGIEGTVRNFDYVEGATNMLVTTGDLQVNSKTNEKSNPPKVTTDKRLKGFGVSQVQTKNPNQTITFNSLESLDSYQGILEYSLPASAITNEFDATVNFRGDSGKLYSNEGGSVAIKMRFKTDNTFRKAIKLYMPKHDVSDRNVSFELLNFNSDGGQYNLGKDSIKLPSVKLVKNQWYDLVSIIEEKGEAGQDTVTTYLNGVKLYSDKVAADVNWKGQLYDVNFYTAKSKGFTDQKVWFDLFSVTNYVKNSNVVTNFANAQTQSSLKITYNPANLANADVDLRFGGIVKENEYDLNAEYGVIVLDEAENFSNIDLIKLGDLKKTGKAIVANPVKVDGGYQFAWVITNMEGHYDTKLNACMYILKGDTLVLSQPKLATSANDVANIYLGKVNDGTLTLNENLKSILGNITGSEAGK